MDVGPYFSIQSIITIILLMFLNSLIIAVHTGLISLNSEKLRELEEEGNSKAKYLLKITSDQDSLNQAFAMVDMVLSFLIVSYLVRRVRVIVENSDILNGSLNASGYIIIAIIIFSMIRLIFIDKIPKRLAVRNPMGIAMATNFLTRLLMAITYPFVKFTNAVTNLFMNIFGIEAKAIEKEVTSEQIKSIVQVGENQGIIRPMESRMIHSIMGFDDLIAEEIMTARTDVFMIDVNDSEKTWLDEFTKIRHSRIPVYEDEVDNILGIIYTKDYLLEATRVGIKNVHQEA